MINESLGTAMRNTIKYTLALFYETASYALIAGAIEIFDAEHSGNHLINFVQLMQLWALALMYRVFSLHLIASWKLKTFLIDRRATPVLIAVLDLAMAVMWAGLLYLISFPPAHVLFHVPAFWIPIFSAIFLGSLAFSLNFAGPNNVIRN